MLFVGVAIAIAIQHSTFQYYPLIKSRWTEMREVTHFFPFFFSRFNYLFSQTNYSLTKKMPLVNMGEMFCRQNKWQRRRCIPE